MDYLSHPLIWYAFGGIGLFCVLNHFIKPEGILRKIMIVELILLIVYAIDVNNIRYLASFFFIREYMMDLTLISILCTMYLEDYIEYKNNKMEREEFIASSIRYLVGISVYTLCFMYAKIIRVLF